MASLPTLPITSADPAAAPVMTVVPPHPTGMPMADVWLRMPQGVSTLPMYPDMAMDGMGSMGSLGSAMALDLNMANSNMSAMPTGVWLATWPPHPVDQTILMPPAVPPQQQWWPLALPGAALCGLKMPSDEAERARLEFTLARVLAKRTLDAGNTAASTVAAMFPTIYGTFDHRPGYPTSLGGGVPSIAPYPYLPDMDMAGQGAFSLSETDSAVVAGLDNLHLGTPTDMDMGTSPDYHMANTAGLDVFRQHARVQSMPNVPLVPAGPSKQASSPLRFEAQAAEEVAAEDPDNGADLHQSLHQLKLQLRQQSNAGPAVPDHATPAVGLSRRATTGGMSTMAADWVSPATTTSPGTTPGRHGSPPSALPDSKRRGSDPTRPGVAAFTRSMTPMNATITVGPFGEQVFVPFNPHALNQSARSSSSAPRSKSEAEATEAAMAAAATSAAVAAAVQSAAGQVMEHVSAAATPPTATALATTSLATTFPASTAPAASSPKKLGRPRKRKTTSVQIPMGILFNNCPTMQNKDMAMLVKTAVLATSTRPRTSRPTRQRRVTKAVRTQADRTQAVIG